MKFSVAFVIILAFFFDNSNQIFLNGKLLPFAKLFSQEMKSFETPQDAERMLKKSIENLKVQRQFHENFPFFCDVKSGKNGEVPISVHELRPGDIDVVGALGDSLTVAAGAFKIYLKVQ